MNYPDGGYPHCFVRHEIYEQNVEPSIQNTNFEKVCTGGKHFQRKKSTDAIPAIDIQEQKDKYIVHAEIPRE
jgi:hypothetical protein